jgi:hypothetical protein
MRKLAFLGVAVLSFLFLGIVYLLGIWGPMTFGGECAYEEVKCDAVSEFVASDVAGWLALVIGIALAFLSAWFVVLRGRTR